MTRPMALRAFFRVLPHLTPFDFAAFLQVHFTKVEEQIDLVFEEWVKEAQRKKLPTDALVGLYERAMAKRAQDLAPRLHCYSRSGAALELAA